MRYRTYNPRIFFLSLRRKTFKAKNRKIPTHNKMEHLGKILIIDDNEDVLFALNLLLEPYAEKVKVTTQPDRIEHFMTSFCPDLVLLDIKEFNPGRHEELTGRSNTRTLKTALWLEEHCKPFWLRYVLVPGYSDFEEDIRALGSHFKDYRMIKRVEILPYHTLGVNKYESLGQEYRLKNVPLNTKEQLSRAESLFNEYFSCVVLN